MCLQKADPDWCSWCGQRNVQKDPGGSADGMDLVRVTPCPGTDGEILEEVLGSGRGRLQGHLVEKVSGVTGPNLARDSVSTDDNANRSFSGSHW